ncbi:MAG TPA: choice-of-anchor tandem repeat GloVer-containing protein [Verrucomicrobiae bacterium]|nr:choice-of-anchor tandem repeat GloVer-containing protein [Verrucomicrobiae bacterium]
MKFFRILAAIAVFTLVGKASGQTLTILHLFSGGSDGHNPVSGLIQASNGFFYGTTQDGDPEGGNGTVFQISSAGTFTTLYSFTGGADGASPSSPLIQGADGFLYGVTIFGGTNDDVGTVYRISTAGTLTSLHSFGGDDGSFPRGSLVQGADGSLYGATIEGGTNNLGTIYRITTAGTFTTLHMFGANPNDGFDPYAGLVQRNKNWFYGVTQGGGPHGGQGTIFKISNTGNLKIVYSFSNGTNGANPFAALVKGPGGCFYGTTVLTGTNNNGTVFKISPAGKLKTLYRFTGGFDGATPEAPLALGSDGNFYGTTSSGGSSNLGTAFRITPAGTLTTLHEFSGGTDGSLPYGGLVQGSDGSFYGTAWAGGTNGNGTVFKLTVPLGPPRKN